MSKALKTCSLIQFYCWRNSPFPLLALWGNKNWPPSMKVKKVGKFSEQKGLKGMQMVQFECPRHCKPSFSSTFGVGRIPFSHYWPSGVIRIGLPVWRWKSWESSETKMGSKGCNWSSLNAPGTETPLSHPILKLDEFPFPIISPLG